MADTPNAIIHDAVLDYYSRRLATSFSNKAIKLHEVSESGDPQRLLATLTGHDGPVWQVAWSHPKFGNAQTGAGLLASCGYDGKVIVWREAVNQSWSAAAPFTEHQASVNSVAWAPVEFGPLLLCGSSDGRVSLVSVDLDAFSLRSLAVFSAHQIGVNCVSWAPYEDHETSSCARFVTGGGDSLVKVWKLSLPLSLTEPASPQLEASLAGHSDWVRDVAWSPSLLAKSYLASGSQDKTVLIWTQNAPSHEWTPQMLNDAKFDDVVCRLSWALSGNILAVSDGASKVTLWEEGLDHTWVSAGEVSESS